MNNNHSAGGTTTRSLMSRRALIIVAFSSFFSTGIDPDALAWMNAYYKGEDDPPIIDFDKMAQDGRKLGEKCAQNPTMGLMTVADSLFEK